MTRPWFVRVLLTVGISVMAVGEVFSQDGVPASVVRAFQQTYPTAAITRSEQQRQGGRAVYRIESEDKRRRRIAVYDATASLLELAEQVEEKELPAPVVAAVRAHRRAIFVTGLKVTRRGAVHYELTLRGSRRTAMVVKPDGTVISFE